MNTNINNIKTEQQPLNNKTRSTTTYTTTNTSNTNVTTTTTTTTAATATSTTIINSNNRVKVNFGWYHVDDDYSDSTIPYLIR